MRQEQTVLLDIIRSALGDRTLPDSLRKLSLKELQDVMDYAQKQDMFPFLQYFDCFTKGECRDFFFKMYLSRISADIGLERELQNLLEVFEQHGIDCIPLKGSVTKKMYPMSELRTMGDLDILYKIEQTGDLKKLMASIGYEHKGEGTKHDQYRKPGVIVEMHKELLPVENVACQYFEKIWTRARRQEGREYIWQMTAEDHYIFTLCHLLEHFLGGGIGIRMVLDIYVLSRQPDWNREKVVEQLKDMELVEFEEKIRTLSEIWFGNDWEVSEELKERYTDLAEYIVEGGTYGLADNRNLNNTLRYRSSFRYLMRQIFPSYTVMRTYFSWLQTPFLLPAAWIYRFGYVWKLRRENVFLHFNHAFRMEKQNGENVLQRGEFFEKCGLGKKVCGKR